MEQQRGIFEGRPTATRLRLTAAVFVLGWGGAAAALAWLGWPSWIGLTLGIATILALFACTLAIGGRMLAVLLLTLPLLTALIGLALATDDAALLRRGVTESAVVTGIGHGKSASTCHIADRATGRTIPGTVRNCTASGAGDIVLVTVDPKGSVAPVQGDRRSLAQDRGRMEPMVALSLVLQLLVLLLAATRPARARWWRARLARARAPKTAKAA